VRIGCFAGKDSTMAAALVALFAWTILIANLGIASGTGIICGWQPMPDGSASYECVVQLEPRLVHSLKQGDSIPLSVEVPEHVRPISRIRLVVGEGSVPRQTLATNLKAWPAADKQPRDGVVETQFTTANDAGRYNNRQPTNGAVVPLNDGMSNTQDAFARSLQYGGQAVRQAASEITQDILPPDPGRGIATAVDRASQELGNNLRSASETVRDDIRQLFGDDTGPEQSAEVLPPSRQGATSNPQPVQPILPGDSGHANGNHRRLDQPIGPNPANAWQSSQTPHNAANNQITPPGATGSQWPELSNQPQVRDSNAAPLGDRYGGNSPSVGNNPTSGSLGSSPLDRFGNTSQASLGNVPSADARNSAATAGQGPGAGPAFPPFTPTVGDDPITPTQAAASPTPEIRRDMLSQPANAQIQGANGLPIGSQPFGPSQPAAQSVPAASDFGWNTKPQAQQQQVPASTSSAPHGVFPLLLSWVLLSGSGAGNLYLFWSYLDVRNKYRDLVDDASRRISGRRVRD
jgi:hypothetical protein